ncbi:Hypothetical Protein FCC1311_008842 [Hondaea fermentalgiana]|uniref:Uncharacterized protein n=1 Tax=Hondaea fermentalgiana TaxID=2315210 RepID=A0A2R5G0X2_9STRA|nr:Hypothetical Protein FCC1311_008842 [Hondaea fermentalgiana]|eukprot:GBG24666.1 Hypothetical Protein FCC1311_008842 [Hondaea fermentalgiana]
MSSNLQHVESAPALLHHFTPKYDVFGHHLPVGKGSGLGHPEARRAPRADYPDSWQAEVSVATKPELLEKRRNQDAATVARAQSAVVIRSIAELTGSKQMEGLVQGKFHAVEHAETKSRSKLLENQRAERLGEIQSSVASYVNPKEVLYKHADTLELGKLAKPCVLLPLPEKIKGKANNPASPNPTKTTGGALEANAKRRIGPEVEIIRDRPAPPGLGWRREPRTQRDMIVERAHEAALEQARNLENYQPRERVLRTRPRVPGPLHHIEIDDHDFGRSTKKQYPEAHTQNKLLTVRREDLRVELEAARQTAEAKTLAITDQITQPVLRSAAPWWDLEKTPKQLQDMNEKRAALEQDFERRKHEICEHPSRSGQFRALELELRARRGKLADKPSRVAATAVDALPRTKHTRKNRFTDAVIAFRNKGRKPELDANGKKLCLDPGEGNPLYSSFTPDNKFLERGDRLAADRATREKEADKLMGNVLPKRLYVISRASSSPALLRDSRTQSQQDAANAQQALASSPLGPGAVLGGQLDPERIRAGGFEIPLD